MNIAKLLEAERSRKGFSTEERARMWSAIQSSIGAAATGAAAAGAGSAAAKATATAAAKTAGKAAAKKLATWKLMLLLSAVAIGGAGAGAAAHAKWGAPKIVTVERTVPAVVAAPPPPIETAPPPVTTTTPTTTASVARARVSANANANANANARPSASTTAAAKDPSLARERTLLDMARTALSRGDASAALASLDTHAREFPSSQLAEEREVLAIQALASSGRMPEARNRAKAFKSKFVNSPLTSIVDEATQ